MLFPWIGPPAVAQADFGFEGSRTWWFSPPVARVADPTDPHGGSSALRVERAEAEGFSMASTVVPLEPRHEGVKVTLEGWVRTEGLVGAATFWLRIDGEREAVVLADVPEVTGTTGWTRVRSRVRVPPGAQHLLVGPLIEGAGAAWFDDLVVEIGHDVVPAVILAERARAQSPALWTDSEARVTVSPDDPSAPQAWVDEARARAAPLRSLVASDDFADLAPVGAAIGAARVVQLGESSHGVSEFDHVKVRLVKYLHEALGFDVIAFESGLWECALADDAVGRAAPDLVQRSCVFAVWHTEEVRALFDYLEQTRSTDRPLRLAGFDVQTSASYGGAERASLLERAFAPWDPIRAAALAEDDRTLANVLKDRIPDDPRLADLIHRLDASRSWVASLGPLPPEAAWAAMVLTSRRGHAAARAADADPGTRDRGMAANLIALADGPWEAQRIVVWGHNGHVARVAAEGEPTPMGAALNAHFGDDLYTIGLYGFQGSTAFGPQQIVPVVRPPDRSLEAILHRVGWAASFVPLDGLGWSEGPIPTLTWGTAIEILPLQAAYDAILFVDVLSPPDYLAPPGG